MGKGIRTPDDFWARVHKTDGCWEWSANRRSAGYGTFLIQGKQWLAHRWSWELANGKAIPDGLHVRHTCDNPPCVRPDHLVLGTHAQNMQDGKDRLRWPHGERHHSTKLTEAQVLSLRSDGHAGTLRQRARARELGVSRDTFEAALRGRTWAHLNHIVAPVPPSRSLT